MKFKKANDSGDEDVSSDGEVADGSKSDDRYVLVLTIVYYVQAYVCSKLLKGSYMINFWTRIYKCSNHFEYEPVLLST